MLTQYFVSSANHRGRSSSSSWKAQGYQVETNLPDTMTSAVLLSTESQPDRNVLREGQTMYEYTKQTKDSQTKACLHRIKLWRSTARVSNRYFVELIWISRYPTSLNMAEWISSASSLQGFAARAAFHPELAKSTNMRTADSDAYCLPNISSHQSGVSYTFTATCTWRLRKALFDPELC